MPILWALLWGLSIPLIMWVAIRYWLPKLTDQPTETAMSDEEDSMEPNPGQFVPRTRFFQNNNLLITFLFVCGIFATICGYAAVTYASSPLNFIRMWLVFGILACVTVIDTEFFLIPNKCSIYIILGASLLLAAQWIVEGAFPLSMLVEGVLSLTICLILLLIMAAITRGGFGMGDVKILSSIAFLCGIRTVCYVLTLALIFSALGSAILLLTKKRQLRDLLPLGPFLWLAMGLSVLLRLI